MKRYVHRSTQAELMETYRMIGESESFLDCLQKVSRAAQVDRPVLIVGERGTGKELVAARLHYLSARWDQPRVTINCASFAPELLASEIFGYEPGAFTGAVRLKPGRFELAHRGCLFLDELAQSPLALQEKLLRVLEYGEFERVGGTETLSVDVRVVAATNENLPELCRQKRFRDDLLDRLCFEVITIPPLRSRQEDIPLLAAYFARKMAREMGHSEPPQFTENAMRELVAHAWPGNVRELKNAVERAVYRHEGELIDEVDLNPFASPWQTQSGDNGEAITDTEAHGEIDLWGTSDSTPMDLRLAVDQFERQWLKRALKASHYNQKQAASMLGLSYHQFRRALKRLEISV